MNAPAAVPALARPVVPAPGAASPPSAASAASPEPATWWDAAARPALVVAALLGAASVVLAWSAASGALLPPVPLRAALAAVAAALLPGAPVAVLLRLPSRALSLALATAVSLSVTVLLAQTSIVTGSWHPVRAQTGLVAASLVLCALAWRHLPARPSGPPSSAAPPARAARTVRHSPSQRWLSLGALGVALLLFSAQASTLDVGGAGALGVVTQVRAPYVVALALIALVIATGLRRPAVDPVVLTLACLTLTAVVTTLVSAADGAASVPTGWVHRGLVDVLVELEALPRGLDARFSWAGFFAAAAHLVVVAGLDDVQPFLALAPVAFAALLMAPLHVLGRALTGSSRTAWVGVVLHVLANWYQQDYFAPQALALVLHVTVLATLVWWWRAAPVPAPPGARVRSRVGAALRRTPGRPPGVGPRRATALEGLLLLVVAAVVVSHQLTPVVLVGSLVVLAATGATRFTSLWLAGVLLFTAWFSLGASDFWLGHLGTVLGDVGRVGSTLEGAVSDRVGTLPGYQAGQYLRLASSGSLAVLAALGWFLRRGRPGWVLGTALAAVPFGLVLVQSYGGEVAIRCFVLASPVLAPLAASAVVRVAPVRVPAGQRELGWPRVLVLAAAVLVGALALTATRGLNASFERVTQAQVVLGAELLAGAPDGATVMTWGNSPYLVGTRLQEVDVSVVYGPERPRCLERPAACTLQTLPDHVLVTSAHEAQVVLQSGVAPGWAAAGVQELLASRLYRVVADDPDQTLLRRTGAPAAGAPR